MTLNGGLLLEGSLFWFIVTRRMTIQNETKPYKIFTVLKNVNICLFAITLAIISINPFSGSLDKVGAVVFLLFSIFEHINYFELQLMYDNKSDLQYLIRFRCLKKVKLKRIMQTV